MLAAPSPMRLNARSSFWRRGVIETVVAAARSEGQAASIVLHRVALAHNQRFRLRVVHFDREDLPRTHRNPTVHGGRARFVLSGPAVDLVPAVLPHTGARHGCADG